MDHRGVTMIAFDKFIKQQGIKFGNILDIGCGRLETKTELEKRGFQWIGIDKEPKDRCVTEGFMESIPSGENSYDIIFACHTFEHTEKPIQTLREFKRVCKLNGFIFISTPLPTEKLILKMDEDHLFCLNAWQMERLLRYIGLEKLDIWEEYDPYLNGHTSDSLITIARKTGE